MSEEDLKNRVSLLEERMQGKKKAFDYQHNQIVQHQKISPHKSSPNRQINLIKQDLQLIIPLATQSSIAHQQFKQSLIENPQPQKFGIKFEKQSLAMETEQFTNRSNKSSKSKSNNNINNNNKSNHEKDKDKDKDKENSNNKKKDHTEKSEKTSSKTSLNLTTSEKLEMEEEDGQHHPTSGKDHQNQTVKKKHREYDDSSPPPPQLQKVRVLNSSKILFQEQNSDNSSGGLNNNNNLATGNGQIIINNNNQDNNKQESLSNSSKRKHNQRQGDLTEFFKKNKNKTPKKSSVQGDKGQPVQNQNQYSLGSEDLDLEHSQYKQIIDSLEGQIKEKDKIISQIEQEKISLKEKDKEYEKLVSFIRSQLRNQIASIALENANLKRRIKKEDILRRKLKLGDYVSVREGTKFQDVWIDGIDIKEIKEKLTQVTLLKNELEQKKKSMKSNQKKQVFQQENDQLSEVRKRYSLQISITQKEEQMYQERLDQMEKEKFELIKDFKKLNEEEHSRFGKLTNEPSQNWPILGENYQILGLLGKGGFSEVYKAYDLQNFTEVAVKLHQLNPNWSESNKSSYVRHAVRENTVHRELNHPNIVKLIDTVEIDDHTFATILELCEGPDLAQYLKKHKIVHEKDAKIIIQEILNALYYLNNHQHKIIHYDLKPQNILFHKGVIKISDFGLCKVMEENVTRLELTSQGVGTYWYLPPETFEEQKTPVISAKVDIWSVGVVLFELVYGQRPFGNQMTQEKILKERVILKSTFVQFPQKPSVSNDCKDFIKRCLLYKQEERMDINTAINHPFLKNPNNNNNSNNNSINNNSLTVINPNINNNNPPNIGGTKIVIQQTKVPKITQ